VDHAFLRRFGGTDFGGCGFEKDFVAEDIGLRHGIGRRARRRHDRVPELPGEPAGRERAGRVQGRQAPHRRPRDRHPHLQRVAPGGEVEAGLCRVAVITYGSTQRSVGRRRSDSLAARTRELAERPTSSSAAPATSKSVATKRSATGS